MDEGMGQIPILGRLASAAVGALLGSAIGGPAGGVVGAAAIPLMEAAIERDRRGMESVRSLADQAAAQNHMTPDELAAHAQSSDPRLNLAAVATRAAWNTLSQTKVDALARVLAEGFADQAQLDRSWLLACTIEELEAPHVRILAMMVRQPDLASAQGLLWDQSSLMRGLPELASGIIPLMSTLTRLGLTYLPGVYGGSGIGPWAHSEFGLEVLRYLSDMAQPTTDIPSTG